ncbi:MAG: phosphotransferase [Xenococcaceae cyanobacterium MO_234.B1]|nr:phosphotransferase [Xenococcaceae cyanobacterium MO_234.B1]
MAKRDTFPVIYSTLAPQALVNSVLSQYNLDTVTKCLLWHRGLSDIYLVETRQKSYVLRVSHHHWRSQSDIQFELELLDFLHRNCLPVAYPLYTKGGMLLVTIPALEGDRYAALFPYAPGTIPLGDLNIKQSQTLGKTLGKLHQIASKFRSDIQRQALTTEYLLDNSFSIIAPFIEKKREDIAYLENAIARIKQQVANIPQQPPFWGICWGDPHSGNVHFTADHHITLFDFDQCGYGWRAFDLAKFLQVSLNAGISRKTRDAFFEGYSKVQSLTSQEWDSLQAWTQTAHIWSWSISINAAAIHCWSRLDQSYFTKRLQQLKRLSSHDWQLF